MDRWLQSNPRDVVSALERCSRSCTVRNLTPMVVPLTRTDIGVPTVRVVVPGLRHFWARFAAGRLYDVPVELGWRTHPIAESDLNPTPMFI